MKRDLDNLHFDQKDMPMPKECYHALMAAARSVKEEEPMKRASFRAVLIAAIIIVAMTAVAIAATQLGWVDYFSTQYNITVPQAAQEAMNETAPQSFQVGPMTFTFKQLLTDKRIVLSSCEVRTTDGTEALYAFDSDLNEAVNAGSDTVLKKYDLEPGTTWIEAAKQLNLPLYGVRALTEIGADYDGGEAMEDALWNEDGSIVYFNMPALASRTVSDELPVTLYMAVHQYDAATDEIKVNQWTDRKEITLPVAPMLAEKTYLPEADVELPDGVKLTKVYAEQYATGIYLTATFTMPEGMTTTAAEDALYRLSIRDGEKNDLPDGINLTRSAFADDLPTAELEIMTSIEKLPDALIISDGETEITVK